MPTTPCATISIEGLISTAGSAAIRVCTPCSAYPGRTRSGGARRHGSELRGNLRREPVFTWPSAPAMRYAAVARDQEAQRVELPGVVILGRAIEASLDAVEVIGRQERREHFGFFKRYVEHDEP